MSHFDRARMALSLALGVAAICIAFFSGGSHPPALQASSAVAGLSGAAGSIGEHLGQQVQPATPATPEPVKATPVPTPRVVTGPRVEIPSLRVIAPMRPVGLDSHGAIGSPSNGEEVAWYKGSPQPGDPGVAIVDGHIDWYFGAAGAFASLTRIRVGDQITVVRNDGRTVRFVVDQLSSVPYDAHPAGLFVNSGPPQLTMISCTGNWDFTKQTYSQRLLVHSHAV